AVPLRRRASTLLADLLVELGPVSLRGGGAAPACGLGDGHRSFVLGHSTSLLADRGALRFPGQLAGLQVPCHRSLARTTADEQGAVTADRNAVIRYRSCIRTEQRSVQPSAAFTIGERSSSRPAM